jgi:hypothetical protein
MLHGQNRPVHPPPSIHFIKVEVINASKAINPASQNDTVYTFKLLVIAIQILLLMLC